MDKARIKNIIREILSEIKVNQPPKLISYNKMLDELGEWEQNYLEDGINFEAAFELAHKKIKNLYPNQYEGFLEWLDKYNPGPHG